MSKDEGNAHLKAGRLAEAIASYTSALGAPSLSKEAVAALHANRALAHLKLNAASECVADCDAALSAQPGYVKAMYRRAQAREALGSPADLGAAFRDAQAALRLDPENREAALLARRLKAAVDACSAADESAPRAATEALRRAVADGAGEEELARCVGRISKVAEDRSHGPALVHTGAAAELVPLLPREDEVVDASSLRMPLVGLAVEALERMASSDLLPGAGAAAAGGLGAASPASGCGTAARRSICQACEGQPRPRDPLHASLAGRLLAVARACGGARSGLAAAAGGGEHPQLQNCLATAKRALSLLALLGGTRAALGSQDAQAAALRGLLALAPPDRKSVV